MVDFVSVTALLKAEGFGPRLGFTNFYAAALLADTIASRIQSPINRAVFVAQAASDLKQLDYQPFEKLEENSVFNLQETVFDMRETPTGPTEIWGSFLQGVEE